MRYRHSAFGTGLHFAGETSMTASKIYPKSNMRCRISVGDARENRCRSAPITNPCTTAISCTDSANLCHDIYTGVTRVIRRTDQETEEISPFNDKRQREFMTQITQAIDAVRPTVISEGTAPILDTYRGYGYIERHGYWFELNWNKAAPLLEHNEPGIRAFITEFFAITELICEKAAYGA